MSEQNRKANKLITEKSPYLLQHAYNPVDWYPWCEEAFTKAKNEDKPVFLSIGYSTCHWCHVMERESFEDFSVAELMNKVFVNIKVDREERPDIDNVYMTVCQMMTGGGGWPLTIIMTPDKKPFFSGTYFPKEKRYGRIGLIELINQINSAWKTRRNEINNSAEQITNYLCEYNLPKQKNEITSDIFEKAFKVFETKFDKTFGGFGASPKFPSPHNLMFLLRHWKKTGNTSALEMVEKTLTQMRMGGIFDHIGFGFHRYSTDKEWLLPHFEKMLYDQALISYSLVETFQATQKEEYKIIAEEIYEYVLRDMTSTEGGFYSAEDADSEGEEGKFYVWSEDEINILLKEDSHFFKMIFNILPEGNFTEESTRNNSGTNIPHLKKSITDCSIELNIPPEELNHKINNWRKILFEERRKRIHPFKDDKILTDWNGLMIASFAKAGKVFNNQKYIDAAEKCIQFIFNKLSTPEGKLLHLYRLDEASVNGTADDYAFVVAALLELYEATFKVKYLRKAIDLNEIFINHFYDNKNGGFYFTSNESESLIVTTKEIYDGAVPSSNSVALLNLLKFARITANQHYENLASEIIKSFSEEISKQPSSYTQFLCGLDFAFGPAYEVVIVEGKDESHTKKIIEIINKKFIPNKVLVFIPGKNSDEINKIAEFTSSFTTLGNKTTVYVCKNYQCNLPVNNPDTIVGLF